MHIFFAHSKSGDLLYIVGDELKHFRVRRISPREKIGLIWKGKLYLCTPTDITKEKVSCKIEEELKVEKPSLELTLYQGVTLDLRTFDFIVQKATEIGVSRIVPLITERSFRKTDVLNKRVDRWRRISREAMKQAGRVQPLDIGSPLKLKEVAPNYQLNLLLDNFHEGVSVKELRIKEGISVGLIVGPEGGFSAEESEQLRGRGFISLRLRPYTLRSETAAIVGAGIIMNLAGS
jgi:16S rRNA (uracil1498-N3)-methyltransferase